MKAITPEIIVDDLIEIIDRMLQKTQKKEENHALINLLIRLISPYHLATYFKEHNEIQNIYLKHEKYDEINKIIKEYDFSFNYSFVNFNFLPNIDNDVILEMMEQIEQVISSMGESKEYLKVMYISCLLSNSRLDRENYLKYAEKGLEQFYNHIDILELANISSAYSLNKNFYKRQSNQMNLVSLETSSMRIDKFFKKEFEMCIGFYEKICKKIIQEENEKWLNSNPMKYSDKELKDYYAISERKLKKLTTNMFGFNKLEGKIIKSKKLSIEEKEYYIERLISLFDKSFTNKVNETGSFVIYDPAKSNDSISANEIKLLIGIDEKEINPYTNHFIFNHDKNKSIDADLFVHDEYTIDIKRVNKTSVLVTMTDLTEDKRYLNKSIQILGVFEKVFKDLILLLKEKNKNRVTSMYVAVSASKETKALKTEVGSFLEYLNKEIRAQKLFVFLEKEPNLVERNRKKL